MPHKQRRPTQALPLSSTSMESNRTDEREANVLSPHTVQAIVTAKSDSAAPGILPTLPLEIHQMIVELAGDEASLARKLSASPIKKDRQNVWEETLSSCALACRTWHNLVLRERFKALTINMDNEKADRVLELLEDEPLIAPLVKDLFVYGNLYISPNHRYSRNGPYQSLPWPSFTNITYLNVDIEIFVPGHNSEDLVMDWPSFSDDPFHFLEEAAKLSTIETLVLNCDVSERVLIDDAVVYSAISDICSGSLGGHFSGNRFPSMKTLSLSISMRSSVGSDITKDIFEEAIKSDLPSIFGPEGRIVSKGLDVKLYANLDANVQDESFLYEYDIDDDDWW